MKFLLLSFVVFYLLVDTSLLPNVLMKFGKNRFDVLRAIAGNDPVWKFCDNQPGANIQVYNVVIDPNPPVIGHDLSVSVEGFVPTDITGGTLKVNLKAGFFPIKGEVDLCYALNNYSSEKCPLTAGNRTITVKTTLPNKLVPLKITGEVLALDSNQNLLTCINLNVDLVKPQ